MDTIVCMHTFIAVAAQQSFTGGAKQLGITTNLASKYVRQLEQHLDARLFTRTTRSVTLTEVGQVYYERCQSVLDQFDELEGVVRERQSGLEGSIRIAAPTGFGSSHLVMAIEAFQSQHPRISIDLRLSDQYAAIVEEGFDLAIRFGQLKDSTLVARKLLDMRVVVFASKDYLANAGDLQSPAELENHNCLIPTSSAEPHNWQFLIAGQLKAFRVEGSFQANSPRAIAHMAAQGLGVGKCPLYAVQPFIDNGTVKLLFEDMEASSISLYAVYPSNRYLTARLRALIDHLVVTLS